MDLICDHQWLCSTFSESVTPRNRVRRDADGADPDPPQPRQRRGRRSIPAAVGARNLGEEVSGTFRRQPGTPGYRDHLVLPDLRHVLLRGNLIDI